MPKIADLYGLEVADLDISKIERLNEKPDTPKCKPTNR